MKRKVKKLFMPLLLTKFLFQGIETFGGFTTGSWRDHEPSGNRNIIIYSIQFRQIQANSNLV